MHRPVSKNKERLFALLSVLISITLTLVAVEVVLRFFPVATSPRGLPLTAEDPVLRAPPNTRFVHSHGWNFENPNTGRINNEGFYNEQDYTTDGPRPLIAVIGDSMIEAKMVPYAETVHGRMAKALEGSGRVYTFAFSGAPLSQYIHYITYARDKFRPDALMIAIIANDFDESHIRFKLREGFHHYVPDDEGVLRLRLSEYRPSWLRRAALSSSLMRYLVFHLRAREALGRLRQRSAGLFTPAAGKDGDRAPPREGTRLNPAQVRASLAALDAFFRDLPQASGLPPGRILFLVDGLRREIYWPEQTPIYVQAYFDEMRKQLMARARAGGYPVVDLHQAFLADYARNNRRFDFLQDWHWSGYGHGVAARSVMDSDWYRRVTGASPLKAEQ